MSEFTYLIPVTQTLKIAWGKVSGAKKTIWAALAYVLILSILLAILPKTGFFLNLIQIIGNLLALLLNFGCIYIGIQRASNLPIHHQMVFHAFNWKLAINLIVAYILEAVILMLVFLILLIPALVVKSLYPEQKILAILFIILPFIASIFVVVRLYPLFGFILDKEIGPFPAIKKSFEATEGNFWRIFAIIILSTLIVLISILPLGIGLIWTLPFAIILYGEVYKSLLANVKNA